VTRYVIGRIGLGLVTLLVFVTGLFFLINAVVPGDFTSQFIMTADQRSSLQQQLGIDRSLWDQYLTWLGGVVSFDLGESLTGVGVWEAIRRALASTLLVLAMSLALAFWAGSRLGRVTAWSRRKVFAGSVTLLAIVFLTAFPPALGFLLERGALNTLGRFRVSAMRTLDPETWGVAGLTPDGLLWRVNLSLVVAGAALWAIAALVKLRGRRVPMRLLAASGAGGLLILWGVLGWRLLLIDRLAQLFLITVALAILTFGEIVLITRATMDDAIAEDFVMVARAKGLPERRVRDHHAARAALLPTLSRFVVAIPYLLTGLVILESIFRVGGMGTLIFDALRLQDTPLVAGALLVVGVMTVVLRVLLDIAHATLDPRIRIAEEPR
jgi:peptide/nickel transport system permease protein